MKTCHKKFLLARCRERGYSLESVMPCVVAQDGDQWTIDESHPAFPLVAKPPEQAPAAEEPTAGPGTELKGLLKLIGITSSPNCACNARAKQMDEWGPDECERRMPEILAWLEQEATRRGLPFVRFAAEQAVKLAIRKARKSARREPSGDING
jgi:hypothetical protein